MSKVIQAADVVSSLTGVAADSTLLGQIVNAVNAHVERVTRRSWGEPVSVENERYTLARSIWLRHQDVVSIQSVSFGWPGQSSQAASSGSYYFTPEGRLMLYSAFRGADMTAYRDYVSVSYTYGTTDVPDDLKMAAVSIAVGMYNWASSGGHEIVETSVGSYRVMYAGAVRGTSGEGVDPTNTAKSAFQVLADYATRSV